MVKPLKRWVDSVHLVPMVNKLNLCLGATKRRYGFTGAAGRVIPRAARLSDVSTSACTLGALGFS